MARIWMGIALAAALAVGCSQESSTTGSEAEGVRGGGEPLEAADQGGTAPAAEVAGLPALGPAVIKTADLEVEVEGFADAMSRATSVAARPSAEGPDAPVVRLARAQPWQEQGIRGS